MTDAPKPYLLKILSGPHLGAEILLNDSRYDIGSDESCDIIIGDRSVNPRHVRLSVSGKELAVAPLDGDVHIGGKKATGPETSLTPFQIVTIGTTHFSIGPAEAVWPQMILPLIFPESEGEQEHRAAAELNGQGRIQIRDRSGAGRYGRLSLIAGCAALVLSVMIGVFFIGGHSGGREGGSETDPKLKLEQILQSLNLEDIEINRGKSGEFVLQGYVDSDRQKRDLAVALGEMSRPVSVRVWVMDRLVGASKETLGAAGLKLAVASGGPGKVILSGSVPDPALAEKGVAILKQDVPGIAQIVNRVAIQEKTRSDAMEKPEAPANGGGPVTPKEQIKPLAENRGKRSDSMLLGVVVKAVSLGKVRFVTGEDDRKYFEGALLPNGYVLKAILPDGLVLVKDRSEIRYELGGTPPMNHPSE